MRQKLELLVEASNEEDVSFNEDQAHVLSDLSETQQRILESEKEHAKNLFDVKKSVKVMQNAKENAQKVITLRSEMLIDQTRGGHIVAYEWI